MTVKLFVPKSYNELSYAQAKWLHKTLLRNPDMSSVEFKIIAFLRFSGLKVITKFDDTGDYLFKAGNMIFRLDTQTIANAASHLDWILSPPKSPWRIDRIAGRKAPDPQLFHIPFGKWLAIDNLYQGYLRTENTALLRKIANMLLPKPHLPIRKWELQVVFRWIASVKDFYSARFKHFFSAPSDSLGVAKPTSAQLEQAMNAQIRALTKGDISKEQEILEMPTLRALVELDAQAFEFQELNRKSKAK